MPYRKRPIETSELIQLGKTFGYDDLELRHSNPSGTQSDQQVSGHVSLTKLSSGMTAYLSDLFVADKIEQNGTLRAALNIAIQLDGPAMRSRLGTGQELTYTCNSASIVCLPTPTSFGGCAPANCRVRGVLFSFDPESIDDTELSSAVSRCLEKPCVRSMPISARTKMLCDELFLSHTSPLTARLFAESLGLEVLGRAIEHVGAPDLIGSSEISRRDQVVMSKVKDMIYANPAADFSLEGVAREVGVSVSALTSKFPKLFGKSVLAFVRDARLELARDMIEQQGWTVSAAAHFVGYGHPSNFTAAFRRKFGASPRSIIVKN
ncbi:MAG: AraC family transcriptional regulator [Pseudomonadota bacterium]